VWSVSTIWFVTVVTVFYKPIGRNRDHTVRTITNPMVETDHTVRTVTNPMVEQRPHRKNSYKPNGRKRDHTVRTVINPMVETETAP
jgi:hypothetical protein